MLALAVANIYAFRDSTNGKEKIRRRQREMPRGKVICFCCFVVQQLRSQVSQQRILYIYCMNNKAEDERQSHELNIYPGSFIRN